MNDEDSPNDPDCDSNQERDNPENHTPQQSTKEQKQSFYERFWRFAESHLPPPIDENSTRGKIRKHCKEEIKLLLEGAGFFIGIAVAIIFLWQSCELHKSTVAAQNQLGEMQEGRTLDERAWVFLYDPVATMFGSNGMYITFTAKNVGKTPALYVRFTNYAWPASLGRENVPPKYDRDPGLMQNLIPPNSEIAFPSPKVDISKDYYFAGTVWYQDMFGSTHWSQFCFLHGIDGRLSPAGFHDSCDDVETNNPH